MKNRELVIRHLGLLFTYLFIVWGFYRLLFQIPDPFDEVFVKPLVFLAPVFIFLKKEKDSLKSVGVTGEKLFPSIYLGLALGTLFAFEGFIINYLKYRGINFSANIGPHDLYFAIALSFIAAIAEEVTFRGYFFNRLWQLTKNEWIANIVSSLAFTLIYLPIALFDWKLQFMPLITYLFLVFIFGFGSAFVFGRTKNIAAAVLLHVLWAWPIILFR